MHGRKDDGAGRKAAFQFRGDPPVNCGGKGAVRKTRFLRKGQLVEPVYQLQIHPEAYISELRGVQMQIRIAGDNERIAQFPHGEVLIPLRQRVEYAGTLAVFAYGPCAGSQLQRFP